MSSTLMRPALLRHTAGSSAPRCACPPITQQLRSKSTSSSSPYGKSHRQRLPALPRPTVALFPQTVVMTDGSTFTQWSTSPRSVIRLTRDVNNNPLYRPGSEGDDQLEDEAGRLGRFRRRFENADDAVDFSSFETAAQPAGAPKANSKKSS